jgi:hypothetical protein
MAIQQEQPRRAVLTAIGGAFAALVANAFGRPLPVRAEGETMHVGGDYLNATTATQLKNTTTDNDIFIATSTGSGRGVYGKSQSSHGVEGRTDGAGQAGLRGVTSRSDAYGVAAMHEPSGTAALLASRFFGASGRCLDGTGVIGVATTGTGVRGEGSHFGVYGDSPIVGVFGNANEDHGYGVYGQADVVQGTGVSGIALGDLGTGIHGEARGGYGVTAVALADVGGMALRVIGRAGFSLSGVAVVAAGHDHVDIPVQAVTTKSFVLATLQQHRPGIHIASAGRSVADKKVSIWLNSPAPSDTKVGWQLLEAPPS